MLTDPKQIAVMEKELWVGLWAFDRVHKQELSLWQFVVDIYGTDIANEQSVVVDLIGH